MIVREDQDDDYDDDDDDDDVDEDLNLFRIHGNVAAGWNCQQEQRHKAA